MTSQARLERVLALRRALHRAQAIGPFSVPLVAGLGAGFAFSFVVDAVLYDAVGTPLRQIVDAIGFGVVAAPVWLLVQRQSVRDAHDVLAWLTGWETERWQRELGRRLPGVPRAMPRILDQMPDTLGLRPLRVELLAVRGQVDEAQARIEQLPTDTPWQRFERAALDEWIAFIGGGPELIGPMETAAADIDDAERRLVARTMVAAARARRAAVAGGDAIAPLAAVRAEVGTRTTRYAFPYWSGIVLTVALIGLIASLAVTIAAVIIR